jgi:hypothetical protein
MEIDSIRFIRNQKKTGEYEKNLEIDKNNLNKKMEVLKIKSVCKLFKYKQKLNYRK